jgi:hypothetical protein
MSKPILTEDIAQKLHDGNNVETDEDTFTYVETTDWDGADKYQYAYIVFSWDGKTYGISVQRSGSYFTDYHYWYDLNVFRVEKTTRTITEWTAIVAGVNQE